MLTKLISSDLVLWLEGKAAVPVPLPPVLDRMVRFSRLERADGHRLWIQKNREQILKDLQQVLLSFFRFHRPRPNSDLLIFLKFAEWGGQHDGYHVEVIAEEQGKTEFLSQGSRFVKALDRRGKIIELLVAASEIENFSHIRIHFDERGRVANYSVRFTVEATPTTIHLADRVDDICDHPETEALVFRGVVSPRAIGLRPQSVTMLAVPRVVRRYIGQVAFWQESLRRAFFWEFGGYDGGEHGIASDTSFYVWWRKVWEANSPDAEKLYLFHRWADLSPLIPWNERTHLPAIRAETIALRAAYAGRLATRMDELFGPWWEIRELPRGWGGLDCRLEEVGGEGYRELRQMVRDYGLPKALRIYGMTRRDPSQLPIDHEMALRRFNADRLHLDDLQLLFMTAPALQTRIIHTLMEQHLGFPVPFAEVDKALVRAGLPPSTSIVPQSLVDALVAERTKRTTYRDFMDPVRFGFWPHLTFHLTVPMEARFERDIVNDAALKLSGECNCAFQDEVEVRTEAGVSYWIWPEGKTKDEAREDRKLFRLEIGNQFGKGYVILHDEPERNLI